MARPRQPVDLILAKGKKHLTKEEIEKRRATEVSPCADDMEPPSYLTKAEKDRFVKIADQLEKLGVMGETDTETLARYITAQTQYEKATKELRALLNKRPKEKDFENPAQYMDALGSWIGFQTALAKLQDRYFKQAQTAASALGLTITSRCKLIAPVVEEAPKENKFAKFAKFGSEAKDA